MQPQVNYKPDIIKLSHNNQNPKSFEDKIIHSNYYNNLASNSSTLHNNGVTYKRPNCLANEPIINKSNSEGSSNKANSDSNSYLMIAGVMVGCYLLYDQLKDKVLNAEEVNDKKIREMDIEGDIDKLGVAMRLINERVEELVKSNIKQAILVLGNTGSGKSTLIKALASKSLDIVPNENTNGYKIVDSNSLDDVIKIGDGPNSVTKIPTLIKIDNINYIDNPGFDDYGETNNNIINKFFINKVIGAIDQVKIVLVVEESLLIDNRGQGLEKFLSRINDIFPKNNLDRNITIVISKSHEIINPKRKMIQLIEKNTGDSTKFCKNQLLSIVNKAHIIKFELASLSTFNYWIGISRAYSLPNRNKFVSAISSTEYIQVPNNIRHVFEGKEAKKIYDIVRTIDNKVYNLMNEMSSHISSSLIKSVSQIELENFVEIIKNLKAEFGHIAEGRINDNKAFIKILNSKSVNDILLLSSNNTGLQQRLLEISKLINKYDNVFADTYSKDENHEKIPVTLILKDKKPHKMQNQNY